MIYTTPTMASQLQSLVHASLGIHSLLKKNPLKHNVIDRDKILVPPNWDSWGKIRVLREGFDVELVSNGWSVDLDQPLPESAASGLANGTTTNGGGHEETNGDIPDPEGSTVVLFESSVQDPALDALALASQNSHTTKLEVETTETQAFLAEQLQYLEGLKQKRDAAAQEGRKGARKADDGESGVYTTSRSGEGRVNEHIGPVQFNMGGIQVDADDMVQRLKVCCSLWFGPGDEIVLTFARTDKPLAHLLSRKALRRTRGLLMLTWIRRTWIRRRCRSSLTA